MTSRSAGVMFLCLNRGFIWQFQSSSSFTSLWIGVNPCRVVLMEAADSTLSAGTPRSDFSFSAVCASSLTLCCDCTAIFGALDRFPAWCQSHERFSWRCKNEPKLFIFFIFSHHVVLFRVVTVRKHPGPPKSPPPFSQWSSGYLWASYLDVWYIPEPALNLQELKKTAMFQPGAADYQQMWERLRRKGLEPEPCLEETRNTPDPLERPGTLLESWWKTAGADRILLGHCWNTVGILQEHCWNVAEMLKEYFWNVGSSGLEPWSQTGTSKLIS